MCESSPDRETLRSVTVLRRLCLRRDILDQARVRRTHSGRLGADVTQFWSSKQPARATLFHTRPKQKQKKQRVPERGRTNKPELFLQHLVSTPDLSCVPHSSFFFPPSVVHMLLYFCRVSPAPDVVPVCCYVVSSQPPVTG